MEETVSINSGGLSGFSNAEIVTELASRIAEYAQSGTTTEEKEANQEKAEDLVKDLLKGQGVPERFLDYWTLGDFIQDQSPYFHKGEGKLLLVDDKIDPAKIRTAGILKDRDSKPGNTFQDKFPGQDIFKPPAMKGPNGPPRAFYFRVGRDSGEVLPDSTLGDDTKKENDALERNIIKVVEIEYGPAIKERAEDKPPHLIILYGGGDH